MHTIGTDNVFDVRIIHGPNADDTQRYAAEQLAVHFREAISFSPVITEDPHSELNQSDAANLFAIGTPDSLPLIRELQHAGHIDIPDYAEGYTLKKVTHPSNPSKWLLVVGGSDSAGCLWAVRDLCHYHLIVQGDLAFDGTGQSCRQVFRTRVAVPDELAVRDWPKVQHRSFWAYDFDYNVEPPNKHRYVSFNPTQWIDNMSRWKANLLIVWQSDNVLFSNYPDLIDYAHRRGVRIVDGVGLYSYDTEMFAPLHLKRTPNTIDIVPGQLWCSDRGLCPSDAENQKWMIDYTINRLKRYKPDGLYVQTGEVDFSPCSCDQCTKIPPEQLFVDTVGPVFEAVRREFGRDFWIISGQLNRRRYYNTFNQIDPDVTFLWESSCFPVAEGWANDPASRPEEAEPMLAVRPGNSGFEVRFYMAGMGQAWLDRRKWAVNELRKWGRAAVDGKANILAGLFQTQLPGRAQYRLPSLYSEWAWNPVRSDVQFGALMERLEELTLADPVRTALLSDPPQHAESTFGHISLVKLLNGLYQPEIYKQFHGIRGDEVGDVLHSEMMGDVLMHDSDPAIYNFAVESQPNRATLNIHGCLDDVGIKSDYELELIINDKPVGKHSLNDWPRGQAEGARGFVNTKKWSIDIPPGSADIWKLQLVLNAPDGWIFYDRLQLNLYYD